MLVPAAQYLRMSTEDQQYSIANQESAIQKYAEEHGYAVVSTYVDAGKSGVAIKTRPGLRGLLQDVMNGRARYRSILVYDVSRWGRFQDTDEAAHYEFLCKNAGIPVRYCAEPFENDGTMPSSIMKALKRTMAAEYSRELGVKVFAGQRRLALLGFRLGGPAGYGLRRMMISADGRRKQILKSNERKAIKSDRVILVPGPKREVECIRTIFALAANEGKTPREIVVELNHRKMKYADGRPWDHLAVYRVLKNEKYIGCNTWGKTQNRLSGPRSRVSRDRWTTKPTAFVPIVEPQIFDRVQKLILKRKTYPKKPDEFLLRGMRRVLAREGKLTEKLLKGRGIFDHRTYCKRFGSVLRAYELIGYRPSSHAFKSVARFREMKRLRADLLARLKELFPEHLRIVHLPGQKMRQVVELDRCLRLAIHICRPVKKTVSGENRWLLRGQPLERGFPALICTVDPTLSTLLDFYVVPEFGNTFRKYKVIAENHAWLKVGRKFQNLSQFYEIAKEVAAAREGADDNIRVGDVVISARSCTVSLGRKEITLGPLASAIFNLLVLNAGRVVSRKTLCQALVGKNVAPVNLNALICSLRVKLGANFSKRIQTVPGLGYVYAYNRNENNGTQGTSPLGQESSDTLWRGSSSQAAG